MDFVLTHFEYFAAALGLANIVLLVRRSVWNYPFGIVMVSCYAWIFFGERLYSDALLQIFFLVVQIYGWWHWTRAAEITDDRLIPVQRLSKGSQIGLLSLIILLSIVWGTMMARFTNADFPYWDGTIAMASVVAQILLARRYVENWVLWIIVDILAVGLYWQKGLHPTAMLYVVFLVLAAVGLYQWYKIYVAQRRDEEIARFR